jgi:hypothetical protein
MQFLGSATAKEEVGANLLHQLALGQTPDNLTGFRFPPVI